MLNMVAIFNKKIHVSAASSNLLSLSQRNVVGTLLGVRSTLSGNVTSNDLGLGKWRPFKGEQIAFLQAQNGVKLFVMVSGDFF